MKVRENPRSGKRGKTVAAQNRYGDYEHELGQRTAPRSAAESRAQSGFGGASSGWNALTEDRRRGWRSQGAEVRSHPSGEGQSGPLTGQVFFTAINNNQALIKEPPILDPPMRPTFGPNPVKELVITRGEGGIALKLRVTQDPVEQTLVFASPPCNAGREYCDRFVFLCRLPVPQDGMSEITRQYVERFGEPPTGQRVNIGTLQQVNGWRNVHKRNLRRTYAIVPGEPGGDPGRQGE